MIFHVIAFLSGFILDLIFGDPRGLPHPVILVGSFISFLEKKLLTGDERKDLRRGIVLVIAVTAVFVSIYAAILISVYKADIRAGVVVEAFMTYRLLAIKSLKVESMKVYHALGRSIEDARKSLSMIVGRDTDPLDENGVIKAAVETVAENTSDAVIAPMLFMAVGGPVFGIFYKAVNTLDSMVGYKNDKYMFFGRASAKLDDTVNFIPARVSAVLMITAAYINEWCGRFFGTCATEKGAKGLYFGMRLSGGNALRIYRRDRRKHASPNSAQTESVCAGALGIELAGDASYFGRTVKKPTIGDRTRPVERADIKRANRLMYVTAFFFEILCLACMGIIAAAGIL